MHLARGNFALIGASQEQEAEMVPESPTPDPDGYLRLLKNMSVNQKSTTEAMRYKFRVFVFVNLLLGR